jgi:hypothetical protein
MEPILKDLFKFQISSDGYKNCLDFQSLYEKNEFTAIRHPVDPKLFIVTWMDSERDTGWDSVVYKENEIQENLNSGDWKLQSV